VQEIFISFSSDFLNNRTKDNDKAVDDLYNYFPAAELSKILGRLPVDVACGNVCVEMWI